MEKFIKKCKWGIITLKNNNLMLNYIPSPEGGSRYISIEFNNNKSIDENIQDLIEYREEIEKQWEVELEY